MSVEEAVSAILLSHPLYVNEPALRIPYETGVLDAILWCLAHPEALPIHADELILGPADPPEPHSI